MLNRLKSVLCLSLVFVLISSQCFAHSGRLDGSGGHRVNKVHDYSGRYIFVRDSIKHYQVGKILFEKGDYHYHIHPGINGFKGGIYLPTKGKDLNSVTTNNIHISDENRVGSKNSDKYHKSDCGYLSNIKEKNAVVFEDPEDAEKNNYTPCKVCKPEVIR